MLLTYKKGVDFLQDWERLMTSNFTLLNTKDYEQNKIQNNGGTATFCEGVAKSHSDRKNQLNAERSGKIHQRGKLELIGTDVGTF